MKNVISQSASIVEQAEKNLLNLSGPELWVKRLLLFRRYADYYRELARETSIQLSQDEIIKESERKVVIYQFEINVLNERFEILSHKLIRENANMTALEYNSIEMEMCALNSEIIAKTDMLESLKLRYRESIKKNS